MSPYHPSSAVRLAHGAAHAAAGCAAVLRRLLRAHPAAAPATVSELPLRGVGSPLRRRVCPQAAAADGILRSIPLRRRRRSDAAQAAGRGGRLHMEQKRFFQSCTFRRESLGLAWDPLPVPAGDPPSKEGARPAKDGGTAGDAGDGGGAKAGDGAEPSKKRKRAAAAEQGSG
eukprot:gene8239-11105_t